MAFPTPPRPNTPIPNNPFYYPQTNSVNGDLGLLVVGSGLTVTPDGVLSATGTGGVAVTNLAAGPGIAVTQPNGNVTVSNTGVLGLTAGVGIDIINNSGNYTIVNTLPASLPTGTVTQIDTGVGLTGGPITSSGILSLSNTGVAPGTYTNPHVTVDAQGRITAITTGGSFGGAIYATAPLQVSPGFPQTVSVTAASTASPGVVQLNTSVNSTSTTEAATPSAVKQAYDLAGTSGTSANLAYSTAVAAQTVANDAIPKLAFSSVGELLVGTGVGTYAAVIPGSNGQVLTSNNSVLGGVEWTTPQNATFSGTVLSGTSSGIFSITLGNLSVPRFAGELLVSAFCGNQRILTFTVWLSYAFGTPTIVGANTITAMTDYTNPSTPLPIPDFNLAVTAVVNSLNVVGTAIDGNFDWYASLRPLY